MKNKKGNLDLIVPAILIFVIGGATLFLGLRLLDGFGDSVNDYPYTIINETNAWINSSGYNLTAAFANGFNSPTIILVNNQSNALVITAGNYTVTSEGVLRNITPANWDNVNVTYSFKAGQEAYRDATSTITGLGTFADFWSLIILAIVIVIIVGIILSITSKSKMQ